MSVQINRAKDLIERVGWTFLEAEIGLGALDWLAGGINLSLVHQLWVSLGAAAAATIKVLIAQGIGRHRDGSAIPGGVIKALPTPPAPTTLAEPASTPPAGPQV